MRLHHLFHRHPWHHAHHEHADHASVFERMEEHFRRHAGRHGPFGGGRHGGDDFADWSELRGGGRRGGGRMLGHGDLKLLLLALIEQQPRHGYELIRIIEEMFHGHYTPSPGAIYPTLTMLEELGYAEVQSESGARKLYTITEAGRAYLEENRAAVDAATARTEYRARMAAKLAMPLAVRKAMHALKHALLMRGVDWDKAEAQRIAAILERAAAEIAGAKPRE